MILWTKPSSISWLRNLQNFSASAKRELFNIMIFSRRFGVRRWNLLYFIKWCNIFLKYLSFSPKRMFDQLYFFICHPFLRNWASLNFHLKKIRVYFYLKNVLNRRKLSLLCVPYIVLWEIKDSATGYLFGVILNWLYLSSFACTVHM